MSGKKAIVFIVLFLIIIFGSFVFLFYGRPLAIGDIFFSSPTKISVAVPEKFKGVYLTGWSAGDKSRIDYVIQLSKDAGVNAVVIDVKDYSGMVSYNSQVPEVKKYGATGNMVRDMEGTVEKLHQAGIYVIARITVFQDPVLASARPDLAIRKKSDGRVWLDNKGLAWIDPSKQESWDYNISIAKDALNQGFDEVNFDYIRFPSDGNLKDMSLDNIGSEKEVIGNFFKYLREKLPYARISADLFGLSTIRTDDMGIGQIIEEAYKYFDYVCPMVYPSHYSPGFIGFDNPAEYPYEVVAYSMASADLRLDKFKKDNPDAKAKLRPWLQDFNLGAVYDTNKVFLQMKAVKDIMGEEYSGYLLWSPSNVYNEDALKQSEGF